MFKERPTHVLAFCVIVTICTVILQYLNPGISFFDYGFIIAILLTTFLKKDRYTKLFGAVGLLFIIIPSFYTHSNLTKQQALTQHLFSGIVVVLTTLGVLYIKRL